MEIKRGPAGGNLHIVNRIRTMEVEVNRKASGDLGDIMGIGHEDSGQR
jgi:hypothetical protein